MIFTGKHRVVQIHPTLRCNLRCLHCYSSSGPEVRTALHANVACAAVRDAAGCGYEILAVSGGEPLIYKGLLGLLDAAREVGMVTTVTTNGTLLSRSRVRELRSRLDLLTISADGVPASHDRIRNRRGAFSRIEAGLAAVRENNIRFGFIFTLTQHNVHELDWMADFALRCGASLLQIHPLELVGRASTEMIDEHPDSIELGFAFAEAVRLREQLKDRLHVHLDVATRPGFRELGWLETGEPRKLADAVSPLVIEADGTVVPLTYGFPRSFALGNVHEASLSVLAEAWLTTHYDDLRRIVAGLQADGAWNRELPVMNVYEAAVAIASNPARH